MKTTLTDLYILLTAEHNFDTFKLELNEFFNNPKLKNVVLDLSKIKISEDNINSLSKYANIQLENNLSFVIVVPSFDSDAFDEELNVVPTLLEAKDIIDMDEMTRDLGF